MTGAEIAVAVQVASAAATLVSGVSTFIAKKEESKAFKRNARLAEQKAQLDADRRRRQARLNLGATRAAVGANGITMEGSPLDILADNAAEEELDALIIEFNGSLEAAGQRDQARAASAQGTAALVGSVFSAGASAAGAAQSASALRGQQPQTGGRIGATRGGGRTGAGDGTRG